MKLWTIWQQAGEHTWLEGAWDDESTAENRQGYEEALAVAEKHAKANGGEYRVIAIEVPGGEIFDAFEPPVVSGTVVPGGGDDGAA